jgi:hypothetical protein
MDLLMQFIEYGKEIVSNPLFKPAAAAVVGAGAVVSPVVGHLLRANRISDNSESIMR